MKPPDRSGEFDKPIPLPDGGELRTLLDAGRYVDGLLCRAVSSPSPHGRLSQETYVHAGTIMRCVGNPNTAPQWQWRCGFYPGSGPGECKNGTAVSCEAARVAFLEVWSVFLSNEPRLIFQEWRDNRDWTAEKYRRFDRDEWMAACGLPQRANVN